MQKKFLFNSFILMLMFQLIASNVSEAKQVTKDNPCFPCLLSNAQTEDVRINGKALVATDTTGAPVYMAYATTGHPAPQKPTIVFIDNYFGINGWQCAQLELGANYFTVAVDQVGFGKSSQPAPGALDGINGQIGYSFGQLATFVHALLAQLNIQGPIIFVAVDTQGQVAMKYAVQYASDPLALTQLVMIDTSPSSIVSDDPCTLAFLTVEAAEGLAAFFAFDPCVAACALISVSFSDTDCLTYGNSLTDASVNYFAAVPADVFTRYFTGTLTEDVTPLMSQISIPVLLLYGVVNQTDLQSRRAIGVSFFGYNPACSGLCPAGTPAIVPFTNAQFMTFAGKGTGLWLTDQVRFLRALVDFITGCDLQCCTCPIEINNPVICPSCTP